MNTTSPPWFKSSLSSLFLSLTDNSSCLFFYFFIVYLQKIFKEYEVDFFSSIEKTIFLLDIWKAVYTTTVGLTLKILTVSLFKYTTGFSQWMITDSGTSNNQTTDF